MDYRGPVWIDPERMRRVAINIISNAMDAMPSGGTLTVSTRMVDGQWDLAIRDTGGGIPQEIRPRIFEPFVTTGKEHGTGLGLAIVREIVKGHSGDVTVDTKLVTGIKPKKGWGS